MASLNSATFRTLTTCTAAWRVMFMTFSDGGQTVDISFARPSRTNTSKSQTSSRLLNVIGTPDPDHPEPEATRAPAETTAEPGIKSPTEAGTSLLPVQRIRNYRFCGDSCNQNQRQRHNFPMEPKPAQPARTGRFLRTLRGLPEGVSPL